MALNNKRNYYFNKNYIKKGGINRTESNNVS